MMEFVTGAELIVRAAIDAGCDFFAGYPITPATTLLISMARQLPKNQGIVVQGEDEIASIGFCLGASAAGMKTLTATSGPGMSLYSENIGFAQMAELPIVIVNVQRMGPATGGATTNAEGDIQFMRWITSGGYPLIVLAPTTVEECYSLTIDCFNLAERFRTPVILSTSKELIMTHHTADVSLYKKSALISRPLATSASKFMPYAYNKSDDVPPFTPVGGDILTRINTSTHDQMGLLTKDPIGMDQALRHLNDKIIMHLDEIERVETDLEAGAQTIILAYGTMARVTREAVKTCRAKGKKLSMAAIHSLWPVPENSLKKCVGEHRQIIIPELNLGQYAREAERLFPDKKITRINRIDGDLIPPETIINEIH